MISNNQLFFMDALNTPDGQLIKNRFFEELSRTGNIFIAWDSAAKLADQKGLTQILQFAIAVDWTRILWPFVAPSVYRSLQDFLKNLSKTPR